MSGSPPVALVVGAGDYIGAAIAKRFARGGFTVRKVSRICVRPWRFTPV
jgi:NAD(P)-dependent dehydrogenase (short-subunit alcohol dehydrogenase family)